MCDESSRANIKYFDTLKNKLNTIFEAKKETFLKIGSSFKYRYFNFGYSNQCP